MMYMKLHILEFISSMKILNGLNNKFGGIRAKKIRKIDDSSN